MSSELETGVFRVEVRHPKSLRRRCGECWAGTGRLCPHVDACLTWCSYLFCFAIVIAISLAAWWIPLILNECQSTPGIGLNGLSIRDMVVYQNNTTSTWQVRSDVNVNLSVSNPNTVAGCFTTLRKVYVRAEFKGQIILEQEVKLGLGLKPSRSRSVALALQGDHFPLKTELGSLLEGELRNGSAVGFQIFFDTRYLRNDRRRRWVRMGCDVVAKPPSRDPLLAGSAGSLVSSSCMDTS